MITSRTYRQIDEDYPLSEAQVLRYRRDGFVQLDDVITADALHGLRQAVADAVASEHASAIAPSQAKQAVYERLFIQKVNLWQRHPAVREFVLSRRLGNLAARLSGRRVRVWHDQALFKEPRTGARTPWHQDAHYWPHRGKRDQLSIWIALRDATVENGCMSFIPGTQVLENVEPIDLSDPKDLHVVAPQLKGRRPVTCPLRAGSCTFHNGLTFHYAGPNRSDAMREAFAILYMPDDTTYSGADHVVTGWTGEPRYCAVGEVLAGERFPIVSDVSTS